MINRTIINQLKNDLKPAHVTGLFGARRTGKTILMQKIKEIMSDKNVLMVNGEDLDVSEILSSKRIQILKDFVSNYDFLFIDEAQKITSIGENLKLLVDTVPEIGIFVTGSSSFDLRQKIGEPLTGRSRFFKLFPLSFTELNEDYLEAKRNLPNRLIYGNYPQVHLESDLMKKKHILENIKNGYLLKDILELDNLKDSLFVLNLLRLIAFQIGNDISYNELARNLKTTVKTVQRYLDILEKTYILFSLYGYSKNLRKEYSKSPRFYFWDNGIRNSVISNYNPTQLRDDIGKLWENYCISERIKSLTYSEKYVSHYFWRTYDQQEIDLIEEENGNLKAFEFKYGDKISKVPAAFGKAYPETSFKVINTTNYRDFLDI